MSPRYALYWAPEPDQPLWQAGCAWLGRDPRDAEPGVPPADRAAPWRYGFHATLKAPMRLAEGREPAALLAAADALAARHAAFALPALAVGLLDDFVALRVTAEPPALRALADDAVMQLDAFRAPAGAEELRRRASGLNAEQRALLQRWGYPHVLGRWRFHLTLSDPIADRARRATLQRAAERHFRAALAVPAQIRSICVFEEAHPSAPFRLLHRSPLGRRIATPG